MLVYIGVVTDGVGGGLDIRNFEMLKQKKKRIKVTFIYLCKKGGGGGAKLRGLRDATIWRRWVLFYTLYNYRNSRGKEKA